MLDPVEIQDSQVPRYVPSSGRYGMGPKACEGTQQEGFKRSLQAWRRARPPVSLLFPAPSETGEQLEAMQPVFCPPQQ